MEKQHRTLAAFKDATSLPFIATLLVSYLILFFSATAFASPHHPKHNNPGHLKPGVNYAYFEGDWDVLPNFDEMATTVSGKTHDLDLDVRLRNEHFGLQYTGYILCSRSSSH